MSCKNPIEEYRLPTAEEFFQRELSGEPLTQESVIEGLIEFAKLHCEAMLKAILENVELKRDAGQDLTGIFVDTDSIINAYDLNQIK